MSRSRVFTSVLLLLASSPTLASVEPGRSGPALSRVRSTRRPMTELLHVGTVKSPTFRRLVEKLERSDLIVYVEPSPKVDGGYLRFATVAGQSRWVQVLVNPRRPINEMLAMIGHELQHAVEISENPSVVDQATMTELYVWIGRRSCRNAARACYETADAQVTGGTIFRELSGRVVPSGALACALRE